MITSDYILSVINEMIDCHDEESHVHMAQGYDGVISLLDNIRTINYPAIIIEDRSSGSIVIEAGPVDTYSISLWLMLQDEHKDKSSLFKDAFTLTKSLLSILIRDADKLDGLDFSRISYFKRMTADACGYEVILNFKYDIDLS